MTGCYIMQNIIFKSLVKIQNTMVIHSRMPLKAGWWREIPEFLGLYHIVHWPIGKCGSLGRRLLTKDQGPKLTEWIPWSLAANYRRRYHRDVATKYSSCGCKALSRCLCCKLGGCQQIFACTKRMFSEHYPLAMQLIVKSVFVIHFSLTTKHVALM